MRSKIHKRRCSSDPISAFALLHNLLPSSFRLKDLKQAPYTIAESEAAGGIGTYVAPKPQPVPALLVDEMAVVAQIIVAEHEAKKLAEEPTVE